MLMKAASNYDYIIVDLPPILPVVDVRAVAHLFDAFIMVVEWGNTSTEEILKAASSSPILTDRLIGTVLNKADEAVMRRFEGYSDRGYSSYYTKPNGRKSRKARKKPSETAKPAVSTALAADNPDT
jgi:Mrp family chromosome partitioning ATPase